MRGPWLTSVFGLVLLIGIPIEFLTGLLSYAAYKPRLGGDPNPDHGLFGFYLFNWVTSPSWFYQVNEGIHVMLGLALVPVVLAKLWSVIPKLFVWPPWRSVASLLERLSLVLVVGGVIFEMTTGILNIEYHDPISFYTGHFYGAWAFMAGLAIHICVKFGEMVRALRSRRFRTELRTGLADTVPEAVDDDLVATEPAAPTISRRGVLALVAGTSLTVFALTAGEAIGGVARRVALFGTHYRSPGVGANRFPVNHTAAAAGITAAQTGPAWRLELVGAQRVSLSREQLLAMPLTTAYLPIACTEGWSTVQHWTGVPLADLARLAGVSSAGTCGADVAGHPRGVPVRGAGRCAAVAARVEGERRRPVDGPRLSGTGDRPVRTGNLQPEVDEPDHLRGSGLTCGRGDVTTVPVRGTCWACWRASRSPRTPSHGSSRRAGGRRSWSGS